MAGGWLRLMLVAEDGEEQVEETRSGAGEEGIGCALEELSTERLAPTFFRL